MRLTVAPTPTSRFRRLRRTPAMRALAQENTLSVNDLIWPVFVRDGAGLREPIASMPGVDRLSVDLVVRAAAEAAELGIPALCIFPYTDPAKKTEGCEEAWNPDNLANRAIRAIKAEVPDIAVMAALVSQLTPSGSKRSPSPPGAAAGGGVGTGGNLGGSIHLRPGFHFPPNRSRRH